MVDPLVLNNAASADQAASCVALIELGQADLIEKGDTVETDDADAKLLKSGLYFSPVRVVFFLWVCIFLVQALGVPSHYRAWLASRTFPDVIVDERPLGDEPHVCVLARYEAHQRQRYVREGSFPRAPDEAIVSAFLASLSSQSYANWELHLLKGQGGGDVFPELVASLDDSRFQSGPNSPRPYSRNTWGYEATNFALEHMLANGECDYFLFTNADNLYSARFLQTLLPGMRQGVDLIGSDFVSSHPRQSEDEPMIRKHNLVVKEAGFRRGYVDLGSALVSARAIRESNTRFQLAAAADWNFFERIIDRSGSRGQMWYEETLFFHQ